MKAGGTAGTVYALAFDNAGNLYAGGDFRYSSSGPVFNVARWDGTTWNRVGLGLGGTVSVLAFDSDGDLYAGGSFTTACTNASCSTTSTVNHIAMFPHDGGSGDAWSALGTGTGGNSVKALAIDGKNVYVGGDFTTAGGATANNVAKWDGANWTPLGNGTSGAVSALAIAGTNIYAGGAFTTANGATTTVNNVAKWDGATWSALGSGTSGTVSALAIAGATVYAGGSFTSANGATTTVNNVAKWDGSTWSALGSGMDSTLSALATDSGGNLYAGGGFTTAGGATVNGVAFWDGTAWSALSGGVSTFVGGVSTSSTVYALQARGGYLYLGGSFTLVGSSPLIPQSRVARWTAQERRAIVNGTTSYTFYSDTYPVTITVTTAGTLDHIVMQRYDKQHAPATLNMLESPYYWQIEGLDAAGLPASGFTVTLTFTAPGFTPTANSKVCRFLTPGWNCASSSFTATTLTRSGVTAFSEWALSEGSPTAVNLAYFQSAPARPAGLTLAWATVRESDTVGFNLYRAPGPQGPFTRLNPGLIPAQAPGADSGGVYSFTDAAALPGHAYSYRLEQVAADLSAADLGLISGQYFQHFLPAIGR